MTTFTGSLNQTTRGVSGSEWLLAAGVSLATALVIVSPFFWLGNASGHDFEFHASSWLDAAGQWREGIIYPRWTEWSNYGFGEPRFIFYPPLSWILGAALSFVVPWSALPGVFIVLVQTIAGLSAYALARRLLPTRSALFCAVCYAANPYALVVVYMRSDFAEQLATSFFPMLLLLAMEVSELLENRRRTLRRSIVFFAVVFACVWLSNAPAGVLASYSMALLFGWAALPRKSVIPLMRGGVGLALGLGLAGFYIVPAAYEQRWVNITQALGSGLQPAQNFLYTMINDPEHNLFNWIASSVAILLIVLTGIAAIAARQKDKSAAEKKVWGALLLLAAAATILMFRPTALVWTLLPKLRFVQFPWRWMSILAVPYAYFLGATIANHRRAWLWMAVVFAVSVSSGAFLVQHTWWDSDDIATLHAAIEQGTGFEGTDEYDPLGDDHYSLPAKAPRWAIMSEENEKSAPQVATVQLDRWSAGEKDFRVNAESPVHLAVRLLNYPAWRVNVNGAEIKPERSAEFSQMLVPLPKGDSVVQIRLVRTPDRTFGGLLSFASLMVLVVTYRTARPAPS